MVTALRWFTRIWVTLFWLSNLAAIIGLYVSSSSVWEAWDRFGSIYDPRNVVNYVVEGVVLAPALIADSWRRSIESRRAAAAGSRPTPVMPA